MWSSLQTQTHLILQLSSNRFSCCKSTAVVEATAPIVDTPVTKELETVTNATDSKEEAPVVEETAEVVAEEPTPENNYLNCCGAI